MSCGEVTPKAGRAPLGPRAALWICVVLRAAAPVAVAASLTGAVAAKAASADAVYVTLDRAKIMPYPADTDTVIVGNPIIADVTMLKGTGRLILTGRGFGETNLVFLDVHGAVLAQTRLMVGGSSSFLVVQRGAERETYSCLPRCQPTVALGDSAGFMQRAIGDIQARNGLATGAAAAGH